LDHKRAFRTAAVLTAVCFGLATAARADLALDRGTNRLGNRDAARFGHAFEPSGDVHAVAVDGSIGLFNHVAQMHADAETHSTIFRHCTGRNAEFPLNRQRCRHGPGSGVKHRQHRVPRHVDDATLVGVDLSPEDASGGV